MSIERIDADLCNGCRLCIDTCPMDCIRLDTFVTEREEYPSCRLACPAGIDIRSCLYKLREGMIEEAVDTLRESTPLPAVTGRVCPHPCESECARQYVDESLNISALERYLGDQLLKEKAQPVRQIYSAKTAVVGSGPAGLACAYFLTRMGYPVTVYEALPVLGGMLRIGLPDYRLPKDILDAQIAYIRDMGVDFKTGVTIGEDVTIEDLKDEYSALFFSIGNQLSKKLQIEGVELDGVLWGLDFLRDLNLNGQTNVKDRVVVIGGGNVAIDVALTSLRLGAKQVKLVCLESRDQMPAFKEEIKQAVDEGVDIYVSWGLKRIQGRDNKVSGVELVRCTGVFDEGGKFNPSFDEQETKTIETDEIILAIGQDPDLSRIPENLKLTGSRTVQVDPLTLETSLTGIFAGGDIVSGTSSVVEAIAAGKKASISIDRYLKGEDLKKGREKRPNRVLHPPKEGVVKMDRQATPLLTVDQRTGNFNEVKIGFTPLKVLVESQRCMTCGSKAVITYPGECQLCLFCERDCPVKAIYVSPEKKIIPMIAWG